MSGDIDKPEEGLVENDLTDNHQDEDDLDIGDASEDTIVITEDEGNFGDVSAEINVEELVAKIESTDAQVAEEQREIRRRLEEIREQKERELDSTYNINLDDDD